MAAPAIITGADVAEFLKGTPDTGLCDLVAGAANEAIGAVVDAPPDPLPDPWVWPSGVRLAALGVATDAYKSLSAPGGGYQLDEVTVTDVWTVTSALVRRYEPFYNPARAIGGMVG